VTVGEAVVTSDLAWTQEKQIPRTPSPLARLGTARNDKVRAGFRAGYLPFQSCETANKTILIAAATPKGILDDSGLSNETSFPGMCRVIMAASMRPMLRAV